MIKRPAYHPSQLLLDKKFAFLLILAVILALFTSCKRINSSSNTPTSKKLYQIESRMFQYPEDLDSLLSKIDTTNITDHEQARMRTIRGIIQNDKGEFNTSIIELEKAETVFIKLGDEYHSHINKLIRAFTFEYLRLDKNASDLYVECDDYFEKNHLDEFRFYSSLGLYRMSKYLKLDEKTLIERINKNIEDFNEPLYQGLLYASIAHNEPNDSLSIINYEKAKTIFTNAHRWSRVYSIEQNILFKKLNQNPSEATQIYYNNFPIKKYLYTPTPQQQLKYKYGQAYLFALQGKNLKAIDVANKVLKEAVESNIQKEEFDCVYLLSVLFKRIGDYKNAHTMLERYDVLKEKNLDAMQKSRLLALGAHYRYTELEREKLDLKVKVQQSLLTLSAVTLIFIIIFSVGWFFFKESRYKQEALKLKNVEIEDQINNLLHSLDNQTNRNADLIRQVEDLKVEYNDSSRISEFLQAIDKNQITSWMEYEAIFTSLRPGWIGKLKQEVPELSATDLKYCMCLYFNLNNYTIAKLCEVGTDAIKSAKKRIRDKFGLDDATEIYVFLKRFE